MILREVDEIAQPSKREQVDSIVRSNHISTPHAQFVLVLKVQWSNHNTPPYSPCDVLTSAISIKVWNVRRCIVFKPSRVTVDLFVDE